MICRQHKEYSISNTKLLQSVSVIKAQSSVHILKNANVTKIIRLQFRLSFRISAKRVLYPKARTDVTSEDMLLTTKPTTTGKERGIRRELHTGELPVVYCRPSIFRMITSLKTNTTNN